jgi:hypothetical protein
MNTVTINLLILSRVCANERLGTERSATWVIYRPSLTTAVGRWLRGEARSLNIDRLEQCVHHALAQLRSMCRDVPTGALAARDAPPDDRLRAIQQLCRNLGAAVGGLRNLAMTYADDVQTVARLHGLVEAVAGDLINLGLSD